jgi:hypothetical protein
MKQCKRGMARRFAVVAKRRQRLSAAAAAHLRPASMTRIQAALELQVDVVPEHHSINHGRKDRSTVHRAGGGASARARVQGGMPARIRKLYSAIAVSGSINGYRATYQPPRPTCSRGSWSPVRDEKCLGAESRKVPTCRLINVRRPQNPNGLQWRIQAGLVDVP